MDPQPTRTRPGAHSARQAPLRAAELFAGVGLVRQGLEDAGVNVVWANDIEPFKQRMYELNFPADDFHLGDISEVSADSIPDVEILTASFPCTDVSLAGRRAGLAGKASGLFWQVARLLEEMGERRPSVLMLENVPSLASSHQGRDLLAIVEEFNRQGYLCDLLVLDARHFVPQSRPRLFILGFRTPPAERGSFEPGPMRPKWISDLAERHPELGLFPLVLPELPERDQDLEAVVERLGADHPDWWDEARTRSFIDSMSELQRSRLDAMTQASSRSWATAYRRTRNGRAIWEMRADSIAGCLRTPRGGSSKQAIVEAGRGHVRVRWMTAREYARLQGAPDYALDGIRSSHATFGFGDAVCVPAIAFITEHLLAPLARR
jgi:DNA (cytosine-5)-methyltransferase 1